MDLRTGQWCRGMLDALADAGATASWPGSSCRASWTSTSRSGRWPRRWPWRPASIRTHRPLIFPTSDDQQAGLVGGGAVDAGQMAVILGNSAVVNSSSADLPASGTLDAMRLNWGPYLWMRCYNNGAQFLDRVVGARARLGAPGATRPAPARPAAAGRRRAAVRLSRSRRSASPRRACSGIPSEPAEPGRTVPGGPGGAGLPDRPGVREHEQAGQKITRITVSGGIARSDLMCEILATVLDRPLERLQSTRGRRWARR